VRPPDRLGDEAVELTSALDGIHRAQQARDRDAEQAMSARAQELEWHRRCCDAVAEIASIGLDMLDLPRFSRATVRTIRERLALRFVGMYTVTDSEPSAELVAYSACRGWQGPGPPSQVRPGEGLAGRSIEQGGLVAESVSDQVEGVDLSGALRDVAARAALPLWSRGKVLGAIVVNGDPMHGLGKDLLDALQTVAHLAGQGLDNVYAREDGQEALLAAERAAGRLSLEAWARAARTRGGLGFQGSDRGVEPATGEWSPGMLRAAQGNTTVLDSPPADGGVQHLAVPIRAQGEVIGVLDTQKPPGSGVWTTDQIAFVEQVAEQLSQALENARLYEETQHRGMRERQLREIGTRIGSGADLDGILQAVVEDVAKALGVPRAFVQLYQARTLREPSTE
jgi:GAF domain-containing protein